MYWIKQTRTRIHAFPLMLRRMHVRRGKYHDRESTTEIYTHTLAVGNTIKINAMKKNT